MKDNDIIKALECCSEKNCVNCPCLDENIECGEKLIKHALVLINRLQAEIKRWNQEAIKEQLRRQMYRSTVDEIKSEAIKEFWNKLVAKYESVNGQYVDRVMNRIAKDTIKEMTEQSVNYGSTMGQVK